jgi:hypothetical protein
MDDEIEKALVALEAEKARRLQAQIDAGEIISIPTTVVVGSDEDTEATVPRALANLPTTTPDGRAIHPDLTVVVTGVPRADPNEAESQVQTETASSEEGPSHPSIEVEPAASGPPSCSEPKYVRVTIRNGTDAGDPGAVTFTGAKMRQQTRASKEPAEKVVQDIRRATRKHYSAEEKIRIVRQAQQQQSLCPCGGF